MIRFYAAATAFVLAYALPADVSAECTVEESGAIRCDPADAQTLRDKARAYELFCEQMTSEVIATELSPELATLCHEPSGTSKIYADAKTKRKHAEAAAQAQREANQCKGKLGECREQRERLRREKTDAEKGETKWKVIAGILAGVAIGLGGTVAADATGLVELNPRGKQ